MTEETMELIEVQVTIDQDDIDEMRENGYIEKKGIVFCDGNPRFHDFDEEDYKRSVILSESTLYRNGESIWPTVTVEDTKPHTKYKVIAEYDRPSLERLIESELKYCEEIEYNMDNHRDEYWLGRIVQLRNIEGWLDDGDA